MASTSNLDHSTLVEGRSNVLILYRYLGERGGYVGVRHRVRGLGNFLTVRCDLSANLPKQGLFELRHPIAGVEDDCLVFFELWGYVAFGADERLLSDIGVGDELTIGIADLNVVAKD